MMIDNREPLSAMVACPEPLPDFVYAPPAESVVGTQDAADRATVPETVSDDFGDVEHVGAAAGYLANQTVVEAHTANPEEPGHDQMQEAQSAEPDPTLEAGEVPRLADDMPPTVPPETPPEVAGNPEPQRPFEIRRTATQTLIVSTTHPQSELVDQVTEELAEGIPETWSLVNKSGQSESYYTDNPDDPTYFLKTRGNAVRQLAILDSARERDLRSPIYNPGLTEREYVRGRASVVQEMGVAPLVQAAINEPEAQAIAIRNGFEGGLSFIAPLAAGIDSFTGQKYTVYPWVNGHSPDSREAVDYEDHETPDPAEVRDGAALESVDRELEQHLVSRGINPHDLSSGNLMITTNENGQRQVCLFDSAQFSRITDAAQLDEGAGPVVAEKRAVPDPLAFRTTETQRLVLSTTMRSELIYTLPDEVSEGVPETWPAAPLDGLAGEYRTDSTEQPRVLVRMHNDADVTASNEILLAPIIGQIIANQATQNVVQAHGYASVSHVPAIIAGTDRRTGQSYTIYPYIEGTAPVVSRGEQIEALTHELTQHFLASGMQPGEFTPGNLMVVEDASGARHLHIINTSHFTHRS